MVRAKMPFFFLLTYPDWPLTPFIVFCSDKKYYQYNLFHFFLILILFFGHKNLGVFFLQNDHDVKVDTTTLQVINLFFSLTDFLAVNAKVWCCFIEVILSVFQHKLFKSVCCLKNLLHFFLLCLIPKRAIRKSGECLLKRIQSALKRIDSENKSTKSLEQHEKVGHQFLKHGVNLYQRNLY